MNRTFKRAISSILAFVMVMSCMMTMNVGSVYAEDTIEFVNTSNMGSDNSAGNHEIYTSDSITFKTGPASTAPTLQSAYYTYGKSGDPYYKSFTSNPKDHPIAFRSGSSSASQQADNDFTNWNSNSGSTCIVINPKKDGYFGAYVGVDAGSSKRTLYLYNNTSGVSVAQMVISAHVGKRVYKFGGDYDEGKVADLTWSEKVTENSTEVTTEHTESNVEYVKTSDASKGAESVVKENGKIFLTAGNTYVFYTSGTSAQILGLEYQPIPTFDSDNSIINNGKEVYYVAQFDKAGVDDGSISSYTLKKGDQNLASSEGDGNNVVYTGVTIGDTTFNVGDEGFVGKDKYIIAFALNSATGDADDNATIKSNLTLETK